MKLSFNYLVDFEYKKTNPRSKGISKYILLAQPAQLYPSQVSLCIYDTIYFKIILQMRYLLVETVIRLRLLQKVLQKQLMVFRKR